MRSIFLCDVFLFPICPHVLHFFNPTSRCWALKNVSQSYQSASKYLNLSQVVFSICHVTFH